MTDKQNVTKPGPYREQAIRNVAEQWEHPAGDRIVWAVSREERPIIMSAHSVRAFKRVQP